MKHLSRLKQAAFYPRAITIMNTGRTIRHTALLLQAATVVCFFPSLYCPLNVLNVPGFFFVHLLQLVYHKRHVLHMHGET